MKAQYKPTYDSEWIDWQYWNGPTEAECSAVEAGSPLFWTPEVGASPVRIVAFRWADGREWPSIVDEIVRLGKLIDEAKQAKPKEDRWILLRKSRSDALFADYAATKHEAGFRYLCPKTGDIEIWPSDVPTPRLQDLENGCSLLMVNNGYPVGGADNRTMKIIFPNGFVWLCGDYDLPKRYEKYERASLAARDSQGGSEGANKPSRHVTSWLSENETWEPWNCHTSPTQEDLADLTPGASLTWYEHIGPGKVRRLTTKGLRFSDGSEWLVEPNKKAPQSHVPWFYDGRTGKLRVDKTLSSDEMSKAFALIGFVPCSCEGVVDQDERMIQFIGASRCFTDQDHAGVFPTYKLTVSHNAETGCDVATVERVE